MLLKYKLPKLVVLQKGNTQRFILRTLCVQHTVICQARVTRYVKIIDTFTQKKRVIHPPSM